MGTASFFFFKEKDIVDSGTRRVKTTKVLLLTNTLEGNLFFKGFGFFFPEIV